MSSPEQDTRPQSGERQRHFMRWLMKPKFLGRDQKILLGTGLVAGALGSIYLDNHSHKQDVQNARQLAACETVLKERSGSFPLSSLTDDEKRACQIRGDIARVVIDIGYSHGQFVQMEVANPEPMIVPPNPAELQAASNHASQVASSHGAKDVIEAGVIGGGAVAVLLGGTMLLAESTRRSRPGTEARPATPGAT